MTPNTAIKTLSRYGVSTRTVAHIVAAFGGVRDAERALQDNPFDALRGRGVPLDVVDALAVSLKWPIQRRTVGHVSWVLADASRNGHSSAKVSFVLAKLRFEMNLPAETLTIALQRAIENKDLVRIGNDLQMPEQHAADVAVAREVHRRRDTKHTLPITNEDGNPAVAMLGASLLSIVTGGPGTGKTTLIKRILETSRHLEVRVTAPTGRAARNSKGRTVHYFKTIQEAGTNEFFGADLIVVDEASMLTTELFLSVLRMAPADAHIVLVGDVNQLPPVGAGDVFRDLLATDVCPCITLTTNYRNDNGIATFAQGILDGHVHLPDDGSVELIECDTKEHMLDLVAPLRDCHVLTPHNATRQLLNRAIQLHRWSDTDEGMDIAFTKDFPDAPRTSHGIARLVNDVRFEITGSYGCTFRGTMAATLDLVSARGGVDTEGGLIMRVGDRVIVTKNDGDACNGDVGTLAHATPHCLTIELDHGQRVSINAEAPGTFASQATLAYATTVHKAQGSEFDIVALPIVNVQAWDRTMLYTAATRGKQKVYVIGTKHALEAIVGTVRPARHSLLRHALSCTA